MFFSSGCKESAASSQDWNPKTEAAVYTKLDLLGNKMRCFEFDVYEYAHFKLLFESFLHRECFNLQCRALVMTQPSGSIGSISDAVKMPTCLESFEMSSPHHIEPFARVSNWFAPSVEFVYPRAAEGEGFDRRGRNRRTSAAVCGNGAQRTIKRMRLFQDDRLPRGLGPINCDSPASQSLLTGETTPGDCGRAGKGLMQQSTVKALYFIFPYLLVGLFLLLSNVMRSYSCYCYLRSQNYIKLFLAEPWRDEHSHYLSTENGEFISSVPLGEPMMSFLSCHISEFP